MQKSHFKNKAAQRTAYLLVLVFLVPVLIAYTLYAYRDTLKLRTTENGTFLSPPVYAKQLPFFKSVFLGKWQLIYSMPHPCNSHCKTIVPKFEQIIAALGKDKSKVEYRSIASQDISVLKKDYIAIIDPKGWLILYYPATTNPQAILKDIKRLLRYSHAG